MFPPLTREDVFRVETRRLWLRWPRPEDAAAMAAWVGLPQVAKMTSTFKVGMTAAELAEHIGSSRRSNSAGHGLSFVMVPQGADGIALGMVGGQFQSDGQLELGYHLDPAYWGRGLMSEAVRALSAQVFELTPVAKIAAAARPENIGSIRVLEACGFEPTGDRQHDSPVHGRYRVGTYALGRSRPSALLSAQRRFAIASQLTHELVGLV